MSEINQNVKDSRQQYYQHISGQNLTPLWESLHHGTADAKRQLRAGLLELSGNSSATDGKRQCHWRERGDPPGAGAGKSGIARSVVDHGDLICWFTADPAGEVAPSHRHNQSALRFIVEGKGAFTAVDGERTPMHTGDFILTPQWRWHDHGNPGSEPVVWLDGLDLPLVNLTGWFCGRLSRRSAAGDAKRGRLSAALCSEYAAAAPPARELVADFQLPLRPQSRGAARSDPYGRS